MNEGIILTLAYPESIVMVADEWYSRYLHLFGIGTKEYVRAGHAALVLIHKESGSLDYYDFGRFITPKPFGRVRSKETDCELHFPIMATFKDKTLTNLPEILKFLATHPKLTHGDGTLYASTCDTIDYDKAKRFIASMQDQHLIPYAAVKRDATNCARFVTDVLLEVVSDPSSIKKLKRSKWLTPSTIGNVMNADGLNRIYQVSPEGVIGKFQSSERDINRAMFLDTLEEFQPTDIGTLQPKHNKIQSTAAQWLPGIGAGAWFELCHQEMDGSVRCRRISPEGRVDVDGMYISSVNGFSMNKPYKFSPNSNCKFFHIQQNGKLYRFDTLNSTQKGRLI